MSVSRQPRSQAPILLRIILLVLLVILMLLLLLLALLQYVIPARLMRTAGVSVATATMIQTPAASEPAEVSSLPTPTPAMTSTPPAVTPATPAPATMPPATALAKVSAMPAPTAAAGSAIPPEASAATAASVTASPSASLRVPPTATPTGLPAGPVGAGTVAPTYTVTRAPATVSTLAAAPALTEVVATAPPPAPSPVATAPPTPTSPVLQTPGSVPIQPSPTSRPRAGQVGEVLVNGDFELGLQVNGVGLGWSSFDNGSADFSFRPDVWPPVVVEGKNGQFMRIRNAQLPDRYLGMYQTAQVVPGATYTFSIQGIVRTLTGDVRQTSYGYRLQVGFDPQGGQDWRAVRSWTELPWDEQPSRLNVFRVDGFAGSIVARTNRLTVFIRAWKKWADAGEGSYDVDNISLEGPLTASAQ